jgi:hypothetical protein
MTSGEIYDRQAAESQTNRSGNKEAFIVRSAMRDGTRHPYDRLLLDWFASLEVKLTCDATHASKGTKC